MHSSKLLLALICYRFLKYRPLCTQGCPTRTLALARLSCEVCTSVWSARYPLTNS